MAREHLGLFDTPPSQRDMRRALVVGGVLFAAFAVVLPIANIPLGEVPAFVPVIEVVVCLGELVIATMLYAQAEIFRSRALDVLASGFVFIALLLIPHALTFPGAFAPAGLLGAGISSTAWIMIFRRCAFPLIILAYVSLNRGKAVAPEAPRASARRPLWAGAAAALALAVTCLAIAGDRLLPEMFLDRTQGNHLNLILFNLFNLALLVGAMIALYSSRKSVLDLWLLVALAGWAVQSLLNLPLHARFSLGFYCLFLVVLFTHLALLLALLAEANRLYARLALSTAARDREREARMMTVDAVAAAISHEVGQMLAGVRLSASAGLSSLGRSPPDIELAKRSLGQTVDAANCAHEVLKSVRATSAQGCGALSQFSLNQLVADTVALVARELAARKIALDVALDEALRPVYANRVQIQRVVMNLLMNAIDSIRMSARRERRIAIRTTQPTGQYVLLEVSDTGLGLDAEDIARLFEPFFTTKASGTGLGLSLSHTIVEEHGGRLWASPGEDCGATFYLQLPLSSVETESRMRLA